MNEPCVRCGKPAVHKHHRKLRSQGGDDSPANLIPLCLDCHLWAHANPASAYEEGWLVYSWDDPATVGYQQTIDGDEVPHEEVVAYASWSAKSVGAVEPGGTCALCKRRVPHPKKETSPQSKTVSYRVPIDDAETHNEVIEAAARELGLESRPHFKWQTINYALGLVLQGDRLAEVGG